MPELPEVETTRLGLLPFVKGKTIEAVRINNPKLRWPIDSRLPKLLKKKSVLDIKRRAKYLIFEFDEFSLIAHLGMSGHLTIVDSKAPWLKHDHFGLKIGEHWLRLNDPRRFGAILLTEQPWNDFERFKTLGPEPLENCFHAKALHEALKKRSTPIKTALMDNKVVVGVGNIYACESLFKSRIHPKKMANTLSLDECKSLVKAIKSVLRQAIKAGGTTLKDFKHGEGKLGYFKQQLQVYGQAQQPCTQCFSPILKIKQNQRSTFYCGTCQNL